MKRDDLVGNVMRARDVNTKREIAKLGNEIVFPAAILQPPFFDVKAGDALYLPPDQQVRIW